MKYDYTDSSLATTPTSTRQESLKKVDKKSLHVLILSTISSSPVPMSRNDIVAKTGIRLSSVTARVNELIASNLVKVAGTKVDTTTNRKVEVVEAIPQET